MNGKETSTFRKKRGSWGENIVWGREASSGTESEKVVGKMKRERGRKTTLLNAASWES